MLRTHQHTMTRNSVVMEKIERLNSLYRTVTIPAIHSSKKPKRRTINDTNPLETAQGLVALAA